MTHPPDFRDLVGDDLSAEERSRLKRVHELLVSVGPPPELPPSLVEPRTAPREATVSFLPRRRTGAVLGIAAAAALVAFLGGYLAGRTGDQFPNIRTVQMHGTAETRLASATIQVGKLDQSGNWPLRLAVRNLPSLARNQYYEMFLTRNHKPIAPCGTFRIERGNATVRLNAPYNLRRFDGWIIVREEPGKGASPVVLTT